MTQNQSQLEMGVGTIVAQGLRHGEGCVIGHRAVVGDGCVLGNRVTVGASSTLLSPCSTDAGVPQTLWIRDDVVVGAAAVVSGASIIGTGALHRWVNQGVATLRSTWLRGGGGGGARGLARQPPAAVPAGCSPDLRRRQRDGPSVALPLLAEQLTATFFVSPALIGRPGYLGWAGVRELAQAGMTIGAHGLDHTLLSRLSDDQLSLICARPARG